MKIPAYIVDAFTNTSFKGNPAGVCLLERPITLEMMQAVGAEFNLSETAFLWQAGKDNKTFCIRYFTPQVEVPFCGHATLAAAKVLQDIYAFRELQLLTNEELTIAVSFEGKKIKMLFPNHQQVLYNETAILYKGLGIQDALYTGYAEALNMVMIEVADEAQVLALQPNFATLLEDKSAVKMVVVTAKATQPPYDFVSRCFCPWLGIQEDPVTGAAHTVLARYWQAKLAKSHLHAYQASQRGGNMWIEMISETQILVTGEAVIVLRGELEI